MGAEPQRRSRTAGGQGRLAPGTHTFWLSLILFRRTLICKKRREESCTGEPSRRPQVAWGVGRGELAPGGGTTPQEALGSPSHHFLPQRKWKQEGVKRHAQGHTAVKGRDRKHPSTGVRLTVTAQHCLAAAWEVGTPLPWGLSCVRDTLHS